MGSLLSNNDYDYGNDSNDSNSMRINRIYNPKTDTKSANKIKAEYFDLIHKQQSIQYKTNLKKSSNIYISLIQKSFENIPSMNKSFGVLSKKKRIKWNDYLIHYLREQIETLNSDWACIILHYIQSEVFISANEFKSSFFYNEYEMNTKPKCCNDTNEDIGSLTDSLGGSFISNNTENLLPNDPSIEYKAIRNTVKSYIRIFKEHIFDPDHPINKIASKFVEVISYHIRTYLDLVPEPIKMRSINEIELSKVNHKPQSTNQNYIQIIQGFILSMQTALKLFYAETLNYDCMKEEKDEFVNLICCLLFQVNEGQLYHDLFEYYKIALVEKIEAFKVKLKEMNSVTLYEMGIKEQFRLDESTFKYMKFLIKDKVNHLGKDKENEKDIKEERRVLKELEEKVSANQRRFGKKDKDKGNGNGNNNDKEKGNDNGKANEIDEEEYKDLGYFSNYNNNNLDDSKDEIEFRIRLGSLNEENAIKVPKLKQHSFKGLSTTTTSNTITNININTNTNDVIGKAKINTHTNHHRGIKTQEPYYSAIELFKSIQNYTIPFQKMLILANLSEEITKCINEYWEGMEVVTPPDFLSINPDELLTIFIYIILKGNISEIIIHQQFIADFTTAITKRTLIGYYYTTVEGAISYLNNTKTKQNLCDKRRRSSAIPDRSSFTNEF